MRRPTRVGNPRPAVQRMFFRGLRQHLHFAETAQTGHVPLRIHHGQAGRVVTTVFQTT
ncbi:Uncharacterised protein [Salmonella enterica subsp. salamae]|uniref:Uncharacterized protein n=1 Tax=Salmonella enterica subsp. salamae TaxID=59202 RepID=A0A6D2GF19_SALER|nr:Uncharacterised protein [Salmonella enterica subsp. salamae]